MKKYFPFALLAVFSALISCTEKEEPVSPLVGTWENRIFVDSLDVWFVETLEIKNDTLFDNFQTVRDTEDGPDLGYRFFSEARYSFEGNIFSFYASSDFYMYGIADSRPLFMPKSKLGPVMVERFSESAELTLSSNFKEMDYQYICPEVFEEYCPDNKRFVKVD